MNKYRKKSIVIEAIKWDGTKQTFDEIVRFGVEWNPGEMGTDSFYIRTLEGYVKVLKGDYIIRGINGEFYPCKPDIFHKSYELME